MECPKCGEMIFDGFTTEQRIKDLYNVNTTCGWAKNRLRILIQMLEDRIKYDDLPPVNQQWMIDDLKKTMNGLDTVSCIEDRRNKNKE